MEGSRGEGRPCLRDGLEEGGTRLSRAKGGQSWVPGKVGLPRWGLELSNIVEIKIGKLWAKQD